MTNETSFNHGNSVSNNILKHIVATMSNRATTEIQFNQLFEEYRSNILPLVYNNFDQFSDDVDFILWSTLALQPTRHSFVK